MEAVDERDPETFMPADAMSEFGVAIPGGFLIFPAYPSECDYVRFTDRDGYETVYYDKAEWQRDPAGVMGAIMANILNGPDNLLS